MRDTELYRHLLGLVDPWTVSEVKLDIQEQRVDVWVDHPSALRWQCPECGTELPLYDHTDERVWRHLDSCQFMTYLHAKPPRISCPKHGTRQVKLPWAEAHSRFTALFERLAIDLLKAADVLSAARILRISWDEAQYIMARAVRRGLAAKAKQPVKRIGVDEKAIAKGHKYMTLVSDLDRGVVDYVGDGRTKESLDNYFRSRTDEQRQAIEAVAMDMWEPYILSVKDNLDDWEKLIVFDLFHMVQHMTEAVDKVRRQEHKALEAKGDKTLAKSKYLWLYGRENLPEKYQEWFASLQAINLKTSRAWAIKESLRDLWDYQYLAWAIKHWKSWYYWATHSRLKPVIDVAKMIARHIDNVLTYFKHRITNAVSEGLNSKIQTIKKMAYGFRNHEHFKIAIYFHCGGLQLYPSTHTNVG